MADRCEIPECGAWSDVKYLGHELCSDHLSMTKNDLERALNITIELDPPEPPAEPTKENPMSKTKTPKAAKTPKEPKAKKVREAKPKREKIDRTAYRTIALRVSPEDFDRIHGAAKDAGENLTAFMYRILTVAC